MGKDKKSKISKGASEAVSGGKKIVEAIADKVVPAGIKDKANGKSKSNGAPPKKIAVDSDDSDSDSDSESDPETSASESDSSSGDSSDSGDESDSDASVAEKPVALNGKVCLVNIFSFSPEPC
jgi:hypothetical protein